jgi:4-carboxymuconolactone decarboxylase
LSRFKVLNQPKVTLMATTPKPIAIEQGRGGERLPLLPADAMNARQREVAAALINGPRKAIYGPFVPLLHKPDLLACVAQLGETLRFGGQLSADVRELVVCVVACHVGNQFEWVMHAPLAVTAGIPAAALESIRNKLAPAGLNDAQQTAYVFCLELLSQHEVLDATYQRAVTAFGEENVVELSTLIGYFAMVCWVMNVARTPSRPTADVLPLVCMDIGLSSPA